MTSVSFPVALSAPVLLAPMSGITDLPFRRAVAGFGAGLVVSEMIASGEMVTARPSRRAASRARAEVDASVPSAVQIAGRDARAMAEAARLAEGQGAPMIDINMGCPAKKVVGGLSGAALMRVPGLALALIEAVVGAVNVPVTLKMRLGWNAQSLNGAALARRAEAVGVRMITVHGRTRAQFYSGQVDWRAVRAVTEAVNIPVIVNGDIVDGQSARAALAQSGAAGVMIGRGARGRPWLLAQVASALYGTAQPMVPTGAQLAQCVGAHYEAMLSFYGRDLGLRVARKHLGWYIDAARGPSDLRALLLRETDPAVVLHALPEALTPRRRAA